MSVRDVAGMWFELIDPKLKQVSSDVFSRASQVRPPPPITAVLPAASGLFLEENTADLTRS